MKKLGWLAVVLMAPACVMPAQRNESGISMRTEKVEAPRPESCPASVSDGDGGQARGAKPFASTEDLKGRVGTTVWFASSGRIGDWGNEYKYRLGDAVVLCSERPFENTGRVASLEVLEATTALIKRKDGKFFNAPINALSMQKPRFDAREEELSAEDIGAAFLEWHDAKTFLAENGDTHSSAPLDRTKPSFWAMTHHKFFEGVAQASWSYRAAIDKLTDRGQFKAFEPLMKCSRAKPDNPVCQEARTIAEAPPAATGAARKGGTLLLSVRPIVAETVVRVDGKEVAMVDGRVEVPFDADGEHEIEVVAPKKKVWKKEERVSKGDPKTVPVVLLPD